MPPKSYEVTIGMIFMNSDNYDKLCSAIWSIFSKAYYNIHFILIDNTGTDFFIRDPEIRRKDTLEPLFLQFKDVIDPNADVVQYIKRDKPASVAENWNYMYEKSESPVVIFCNDDIVVNEYFDKILFDTVMTSDMNKTAVASFPEVYPYKELLIDDWNSDKTVDWCKHGLYQPGFNGACWGVRRSLLKEIAKIQPNKRPFDTRYLLACYEDIDFWMVATNNFRKGFKICYESFIFHYGASTRNSPMVQKLQNEQMSGLYHIDYNRELFKAKWKISQSELERLEKYLYKGWNNPNLDHIVKTLADKQYGDKK